LVDDHPANLLALEAVLEPLGHELVLAQSGEEALRCLLRQEFALILMDVRMPDMDGFQTVALIKQRPKMMDIDISTMLTGKFRLHLEEVDLAAVVQSAVESARPSAEKKRIELVSNLEAVERIQSDAAKLQQILGNLLSNAIKFVPEGGKVTVNLRRAGERVGIEVSDMGIGIALENLPHVFERFWQAERPATMESAGLGLGLAIADQLARLHGGEIRAASPGIGRGASFTLRLPLDATVEQRRGA
jgi:signal transduction histidine kinase